MSLSQYYVDKNSSTPLYKQVEDIISELLTKEPYDKGAKLPNEIEISNKLNVSRNTVRKAMYSLINKNLIIRKKNRGTFKNIQDNRIKTTLNNWYSFNDDMQRQNRKFKLFEHGVSLVRADCEVYKKFQIKPNRKIIQLVRVKGYLEPELYVKSYFHPDLNLEIEDLNDGNIIKLYEFLEGKLNIKILFSQEEILAAMPVSEIKKHLSFKDDKTPVLIRKMLIHDENGRKIAYSIGYYLSDRFVFDLHISR
ncbi:MAG: GntR family transcriptional regulator [Epsilonproteobacteria bacterium]|nr:GntR family transcriptional regulator [Campylobacterota bacterium]